MFGLRSVLILGLLVVFSGAAQAQMEPSEVEVMQLTDKIYVLTTSNSGNVGAYIGDEGTFIIDDKFSVDGPSILAALESIGGGTPEYLVNTHFHGDHSGSNEFFGEKGSLIVAHNNVYTRLAEGYEIKRFNSTVGPASKAALPRITYASGLELHLDGHAIKLIHVPNAHTDTDSIVYFEDANVIHAGDTLFNGFFPFIDTSHGGTLLGVIQAQMLIAELADENTQIIPGHGAVTTKASVLSTTETLRAAHDRLSTLKNDGKSLEQAIAAKPLTDIEESWGGVMFTADQWISVVWEGL